MQFLKIIEILTIILKKLYKKKIIFFLNFTKYIDLLIDKLVTIQKS